MSLRQSRKAVNRMAFERFEQSPRPQPKRRPNNVGSTSRLALGVTAGPCPRLNIGRKNPVKATILAMGLAAAAPLVFAEHKNAKGYERFVREIRHELVMLPYYGVFDNLYYKVDGYN